MCADLDTGGSMIWGVGDEGMGFGDLELGAIWVGKHDSDISERCGVGQSRTSH